MIDISPGQILAVLSAYMGVIVFLSIKLVKDD